MKLTDSYRFMQVISALPRIFAIWFKELPFFLGLLSKTTNLIVAIPIIVQPTATARSELHEYIRLLSTFSKLANTPVSMDYPFVGDVPGEGLPSQSWYSLPRNLSFNQRKRAEIRYPGGHLDLVLRQYRSLALSRRSHRKTIFEWPSLQQKWAYHEEGRPRGNLSIHMSGGDLYRGVCRADRFIIAQLGGIEVQLLQ